MTLERANNKKWRAGILGATGAVGPKPPVMEKPPEGVLMPAPTLPGKILVPETVGLAAEVIARHVQETKVSGEPEVAVEPIRTPVQGTGADGLKQALARHVPKDGPP